MSWSRAYSRSDAPAGYLLRGDACLQRAGQSPYGNAFEFQYIEGVVLHPDVRCGPCVDAVGTRVRVLVWDAIARNGHLGAASVVDHHRALKERATKQNAVRLLSCREVDTGESAEL